MNFEWFVRVEYKEGRTNGDAAGPRSSNSIINETTGATGDGEALCACSVIVEGAGSRMHFSSISAVRRLLSRGRIHQRLTRGYPRYPRWSLRLAPTLSLLDSYLISTSYISLTHGFSWWWIQPQVNERVSNAPVPFCWYQTCQKILKHSDDERTLLYLRNAHSNCFHDLPSK